MDEPESEAATSTHPVRVDVYAGADRKSASLTRALRRRGIDFTLHDIDEDSAGAAAIRAESGDAGPIVTVGALSSVDPALDALEVLVRRFAPAAIHKRSLRDVLLRRD